MRDLAITAAKKLLRRELRAKLAGLRNEIIQSESQIVTAKLLQLDQYKQSENISVYISTPTETSTVDIIRDIFNKGKKCFVPQWNDDEMEMVYVSSWEQYVNLPLNKWSIPEPPHDGSYEEVPATQLDLIVMPGLAFDREGYRMGHGKGYYDRFLDKSRAQRASSGIISRKPFTVALALSAQYVDSVPHDDLDLKPDMILNPME
ncbi:hypothetical protein SeMB42_g02197 [Synchytrium endobioticum]|uniref:5-formyltetrahydrofolate cyclo-ligase n=1 Tax=Synchytrium endobioticum TaxID=286115 RepID=A0A507CZM2_9FUNG|nr:hypothetical protein SeLEV6574_g04383 [Synchytrium endobioticum]TPX50571.1 hypothetical protein SeMB42_g02197 [Synchytrium endobioticum]